MKIFFIALSVIGLFGCSTLKNPFFYEVEKDQQKSYVLGTAHIGFAASELPSYVRAHFKEAPVFGTEIRADWNEKDFAKKTSQEQVSRILENQSNGYKLSDHLSPVAWQKLREVLLPSMRSEKYLQALTPAVAYYELAKKGGHSVEVSRTQYNRLEFDKMDMELYQAAKKGNKIFLGLDHIKFIEDSCEDAWNLYRIEIYVAGGFNDNAAIDNFFEAYRSGDETKLGAFVKATTPANTTACIFTDRNKLWAEKIERMNSIQTPMFIAVGAGHLVGENNLFIYLKAAGFTVRRISQ
jgi:uncharacterized protein YbaP (TraB family)